jgi:hypothetical protein
MWLLQNVIPHFVMQISIKTNQKEDVILKLFRNIICLFLILFSVVGCTLTNNENQLPNSKPADFNFIFNYGINAKNQLNTIEGTYTKDMVLEESITTDLKLSDEEMDIIYLAMKDINILNYPENFTPKSNTMLTPYQTYSMKIYFSGKEKSIYWKDENVSKTKEATQLRELFIKIEEFIYNKEEYKKLPQPKSGYA